MGYGKGVLTRVATTPAETDLGRLYSYAFIIGNVNKPSGRFVYLVLDIAIGDTAIRYATISALASASLGIYNQTNLALKGIKSHSPTCCLNLYANLANPAEERANCDSSVDTTLSLLRFQRASDGLDTGVLGKGAGLYKSGPSKEKVLSLGSATDLSCVHGTSMLENNTYITGDNKGLSSYLFEQSAISDSNAASGFVAAFSQSSIRDTTPDVLGAWYDDDTRTQCTFDKGICGGTSQTCHGRGPAFQKLELGVSSCYEICRRVSAGAKFLYDSLDTVRTAVADSSVKLYHVISSDPVLKVAIRSEITNRLSKTYNTFNFRFQAEYYLRPAPQHSAQFSQQEQQMGQALSTLRKHITTRKPKISSGSFPKSVLLYVGEMSIPYAWSPNIIGVQSFRVGQLIMIISPSEGTNMTGRRWKAGVSAAAVSKGNMSSTSKVVLGGPANTYAHYAATPEEHGIQRRYEGASTLYGQWEANAYMYLSEQYIGYFSSSNSSQRIADSLPPNNVDTSISLVVGVTSSQPKTSYTIGSVMNATSVGAYPRNNLRQEGTSAEVQKSNIRTWIKVRDNADWFLLYPCYRDDSLLSSSHVVLNWEMESVLLRARIGPSSIRTAT
ncbi:unnamed protein product [Diplocarpon coronariae]